MGPEKLNLVQSHTIDDRNGVKHQPPASQLSSKFSVALCPRARGRGLILTVVDGDNSDPGEGRDRGPF